MHDGRSLLSYDQCLSIFRTARAAADSVGGEALLVRAKRRERAERLSRAQAQLLFPESAPSVLTEEELQLCVRLGLVRQLRRLSATTWEYDITDLGRVLVRNQERVAACEARR